MKKQIELIFFEHKNSFTLQIVNLPSLSVEQIHQLERFTEKRRGIFDFYKARITIQKRLEQKDVAKLFQLLDISVVFIKVEDIAQVESKNEEKSSKKEKITLLKKAIVKIPFGKHKGKLYSDLPDNYLEWLSKNYSGPENLNITQELLRRSV